MSELAVYVAPGGLGFVGDEGRLCERLLGESLPGAFASTDGGCLDLAGLSRKPLLLFVHPGVDTGVGSPRDPDGLLGSGCTLQCRGFRGLDLDFQALGIRVVGLSTSPTAAQRELQAREGLDFTLLSDPTLRLHAELGLPTYIDTAGQQVYERVSLLAYDGAIQRVFHPIPIPRRNATDILTQINQQNFVAH